MKPLVSVIIPTSAGSPRVALLWRALDSLLNNQNGLVLPIVVVNGSRYISEAVESLKRRRDIRYLYLDASGPTVARLAGRKTVDTEFFGMLDDDDEYLPAAVEIRLGPLLRDASIDVVVTNGYRQANGHEVIDFPEFSTIERDPQGRLMDFAWLRSCGGLYRTETVSAKYLDVPGSMELTYMALHLTLSRQVLTCNVPTYRWYDDSPGSLSRTQHYMQGAPQAIRQMIALNPPGGIKRRLRQKYAASLHYLSELERASGNYRAAWHHHLKCLGSTYGITYLPYTRHLVRTTLGPQETTRGLRPVLPPPFR